MAKAKRKQQRLILYVITSNGRPVLTEGGNLIAYRYRDAAVMGTTDSQKVRRAEIKLLRG